MNGTASSIAYWSRQSGNTTWLLKAAINNPNCIIIAKNGRGAKELQNRYYSLLNEESWLKRIWWKLFGRKHPSFRTIDYSFNGLKKPIIFDNSSLIN